MRKLIVVETEGKGGVWVPTGIRKNQSMVMKASIGRGGGKNQSMVMRASIGKGGEGGAMHMCAVCAAPVYSHAPAVKWAPAPPPPPLLLSHAFNPYLHPLWCSTYLVTPT